MSAHRSHPLLDLIDVPDDLRALSDSELDQLCSEVREYLIDSVAESGGHFAGSLGAIELTVALHAVFDTPRDRLVWDVGHQAYAHKILTGRRDRMRSIRKLHGLSGFPKRDESDYDTFGVGHSSTSISAGLGMAVAAAQQGIARKVVAVIGDGGMTGGLAYEALDHGGGLEPDLLVVLNDNEMSISPNVGALPKHFNRLISSRIYATVREGSKRVMSHLPHVWEFARRAERHVKGMVVPGTLFEELGFSYFGPVDGHDLKGLLRILRQLRAMTGPRLLHIVTRKGQGYAPAEEDPVKYHAVAPFDRKIGVTSAKPKIGAPTYTEVFGRWICDIAVRDERVVAITPAMREGSGLVEFERKFPDRYFDVGIAEQHSITFAAGLACDGLKPVVAIYSTFLQRAYDQLIHDVAIQNLPVLLAIDRAGLVGPDGATHAGSFDLSYLRCVPNLVVMAPSDENECRQMLYTGLQLDQPAAVRYPRGKGPGVMPVDEMQALMLGRGEIRRQGRGMALLAFGAVLQPALEAAECLDATVANMRFVKPLDAELIVRLAEQHDALVTLEDNAVAGGAGSAVLECLAARGIQIPVLNLGIPDRFIEHGSREECLADAGLDASSIEHEVAAFLRQQVVRGKITAS